MGGRTRCGRGREGGCARKGLRPDATRFCLTDVHSISQTHSDTVSPTLVPIILLFSYHHHMFTSPLTSHNTHAHTHWWQALSKSMDTTTLTPEKMEFAVLTRKEGKMVYRPLTDEETARMCAKVEAEMATEGDA